MGILRKMYAFVFLLLAFSGMLALPAAATSTTTDYNGLEVTIQMDKEVYNEGEPITATITVKNTTSEAVTIANLEQLIPEGYKLSPNAKTAVTNVELRPNGVAELKVTFEKDPEKVTQEQDLFGKLLYGETAGIPNLLIAVVLAIIFAIFMFLT